MLNEKLNDLINEFGRGSQRRLAEFLNETPTNINRYVKGKREIPNSLIPKIAEFFDVSILDFFPNAQQQKQKIINEELKDPSQETKKQIQKHCNSNNFLGDNNFVGNSEVTQNNNYKETLTAKEQLLLEFFREARPELQKEMFNYITSK